jgi:hypothetical protein
MTAGWSGKSRLRADLARAEVEHPAKENSWPSSKSLHPSFGLRCSSALERDLQPAESGSKGRLITLCVPAKRSSR